MNILSTKCIKIHVGCVKLSGGVGGGWARGGGGSLKITWGGHSEKFYFVKKNIFIISKV